VSYTFKDGQKMLFNVLGVPLTESVFDTFPDLKAMFADMGDMLKAVTYLTPDQIIRYIVLVYDPKSPLVLREENIISRKKAAMVLIGAKVDTKGFFSDGVNAIIANKNMPAIELKMRFLRFTNNMVWMQLCNATEMFFEFQRIIGQAISDDAKKSPDELIKIRLSTQKDSEVLEAKMEKLADKLFIGDIDLMNFVGSTIVKDEIKLKLTPESRASKN
jgi:hypothetical protein